MRLVKNAHVKLKRSSTTYVVSENTRFPAPTRHPYVPAAKIPYVHKENQYLAHRNDRRTAASGG